jgi:hypothetical protein
VYRDSWFPGSLAIILTLYPLSIAAAIANVTHRQEGLGLEAVAGRCYAAGAAFAALHFAFGLRDLAILARIGGEDGGMRKDKDSERSVAMADWVSMNRVRGLVADLPACVCYLIGFILATA